MGFSVVGSLAAVVGGILIIVGIVLYCGTGGAYLPFTDYAIAIDVQSEESKVTLYKWNEDKKVVEDGNCIARNGIDYRIEKSGEFNHLLYCVQELASRVNSEHKIPVLLDASSGFQLLEEKNKSAAESLLIDINDSLKNLPVNGSRLIFAKPKIVSGKREALDAWIATNYLIQTSQEKMNGTDNKGETVGILDMGGASTNIAYEVLSDHSNSEANILGKKYFLKTASNLCYGIHQALNRYYSLLIKDFHTQTPSHSFIESTTTKKPQTSENYPYSTSASPLGPYSAGQPKIVNYHQEGGEPPVKHNYEPNKVENSFPPSNEGENAKKHENIPSMPEETMPVHKEDETIENHHEPVNKEMTEEKKKTPRLTPEDKALENAVEKMEDKNAGVPNPYENPKVFKREVKESDRPDVSVEQITIPDPCSNTGLERKVKGAELLNEICVNNADGKPPVEQISANLEYKFVGSNDPVKCSQYITKLTNYNECRQNFQKCASNNITVPTGAMFVAFSNYYKITRAIPELRVSPTISLEKYKSSTKSFCDYPWNFVAKSTEHLCEANEEDCKNYCFGLHLIDRTLSDLYNFGVHDWNNMLFVNKIHNTHLNWVLGDVLLASNKVPGGKPTPPVLPMYGLILMLVAGVVLLGYGLANMYTVHSKRSHYESV